jgi:hypothetical protein
VKKEIPKLREKAFMCMFYGRAGHLDEFCCYRKRIEKSLFDYARNSYLDEFIDFLPCSYSRVLPRTSSHDLSHFFHGSNHRSYGFVHERIALCLDALVMAHVLIVVIVSHVGPIFLLEGLTPTLSVDTWTVHVFPVVVLVPLVQRLRCKEL